MAMTKLYEGIAADIATHSDPGQVVQQKVYVTLINESKRELEHHVKHSCDGFSWGYLGSGPAELARCILWDHLSHEPHAMLYQKFKRDYIAQFKIDENWILGSHAINAWLEINREIPREA